MPRPQVDTKCLNNIKSVMANCENIINSAKDKFVLSMVQQNAELTDCITAACFAFARAFAGKFGIEPTEDNLRELIGDAVFMNGMAPLIKALIKADEEASNMSEETKQFSGSDVFSEVCEQSAYAIRILGASKEALLESHIGKEFGGNVPRAVMMHAMSRAITDADMPNFDRKKFMRGIISVCVFLLEDEDVNIALRIDQELRNTDKEGK